jgi:hypothetical protein
MSRLGSKKLRPLTTMESLDAHRAVEPDELDLEEFRVQPIHVGGEATIVGFGKIGTTIGDLHEPVDVLDYRTRRNRREWKVRLTQKYRDEAYARSVARRYESGDLAGQPIASTQIESWREQRLEELWIADCKLAVLKDRH